MIECPVSTIEYLGSLADWLEEQVSQSAHVVRKGQEFVLVPVEAFEQLTSALRKVLQPTPQQLESSVSRVPLSPLLVQVIENHHEDLHSEEF